MQLIVGLGNPGPRYATTRHNFGFWVVDALAQQWRLAFKPGTGEYVCVVRSDGALAVIKPTAFMNDSGGPVSAALAFFGAAQMDMLVVSDDIDLPLGSMRFRARGSAGGHKGLAAVIFALESDEFPRLRLGIATDVQMRPSEKYVLEPFRSRDEPLVKATLRRALDGIHTYLQQGVDEAMTRFNPAPMGEPGAKLKETSSR